VTSEGIPGGAGIGRGEVRNWILLRSVRTVVDGLRSSQRLRWARGWSTEGARCLLLLLLLLLLLRHGRCGWTVIDRRTRARL
jgi:hypothetical protein